MISNEQLTQLVRPACAQFGVRELSIFGSRARGNSRAESDFDFVVSFYKGQDGKLSDWYFGLLFYLEDHLSQPIDLLELDAIRNPYLLASIQEEKQIIYDNLGDLRRKP